MKFRVHNLRKQLLGATPRLGKNESSAERCLVSGENFASSLLKVSIRCLCLYGFISTTISFEVFLEVLFLVEQ